MMKKLAALAGAGAMLLGLTAPVFGWSPRKDIAIVDNTAVAISDTGDNSQSNVADAYYYSGAWVHPGSGNRNMTTGNAGSYAGALVVANTHIGCGDCSYEPWHKDFATVDNYAMAGAYSGGNGQDDLSFANHYSNTTVSGGSGNRNMTTGNAWSKARAWTIVNTHWGM